MRRLHSLNVVDGVGILVVMVAVVWAMHPSLLLSTSLITGGDTGSHVQAAAYLRSQGLTHLTPWFPGWFDGMPLYTFYFVLSDLLAVVASYVIPFTVAFKLATVAGSLLLPGSAYFLGRMLQSPRPIPVAMAMATLPFLFDATYTIDGGNLFSTLAGEYAFSLGLSLSLIAIGLVARGLRTGRGYWLSAVALSGTLLAHLLPLLFALAGIALLIVLELLARRGWGDPRQPRERADVARPVRFVVGTGLLTLGLSAWWFFPFATLQSYTNSMGYTNDNVSSLHAIFSVLGWYDSNGAAGADRWVLVLAALGFVAASVTRSLGGVWLSLMAIASAVAFVVDPQSVIWNERLIPFWFLSTHLLAGWFVGFVAWRVVEWRSARRASAVLLASDQWDDRSEADAWLGRERRQSFLNAASIVIVLGLASTIPGLVPSWAQALHLNVTGNEVPNWSAYNYAGYQGQSAWPEYHNLMQTMATTARRDGCGQAMWEYNSDENRFGTPMALMLLPYWTNNCVGSMEGLFFESSATTPYHFLDQAELSLAPSDPQVGLSYEPLNIREGVRHLQILGVKYFIAYSPQVVAQASRDHQLRLVAETPYWPSSGTRWRIYEVRQSATVTPLRYQPTVIPGATSRLAWLALNEAWWLQPKDWQHFVAMSGPSSWPRASSLATMSVPAREPATTVYGVHQTTQSISFSVTRLGVPVLVKISYFPRWHVTGAIGPYRVSPNLMVVVPTGHHVRLTYGATPAQTAGDWLTEATVALGIGVVLVQRRIRKIHRR